jgi:hypothetical protein
MQKGCQDTFLRSNPEVGFRNTIYKDRPQTKLIFPLDVGHLQTRS